MTPSAPTQSSIVGYSKGALCEIVANADMARRIEEEFFSTEFGDEFVRNSVVIANDGESFIIRARNSFHFGTGGNRQHIRGGDTVKFDRFFNIIDANATHRTLAPTK